LTSDDFAALEGYMAQMEHYMKDDDLRGMRAPHLAFHNLLVLGAGPRVSQEIEQLFDHAERYRLRWGMKSVWAERSAEHRAILEAAAAGDQDLAALRLAEHYARTAGLVFAGLDPGHDLARLRETMRTVAPGSEKKLKVR
jgi:DNA-binding GntR family transcriptional regulator